ncbi:Ger(x)C family spore germination protein [Paenibacillus mesophilus]|uniref:Ger(x)C family spore germination protein n=1 Tax=Paenibacillus mesophilus TaxID=2582849 RepID=UPI0013051638|nr:Ger(x)C family spore germination protein [Paenibacillus mesophilus]
MKKRSYVWGLVILVAAALTGCWDRRELNDLALTVGMGLDKKGNHIQVTAQIVNPGEVASKKGSAIQRSPITSFKATDTTVTEAIRKLSVVAPRQIFPSHLRVLIIGEELARQGISKVMDGISRNHEFRSDFFLIVAKGTSAEDVLGIVTQIEQIPANKMFKMLQTSERLWAPTVSMQLDKFISDLSNPTKDTVLTGIKIVGDKEIGPTIQNVGDSEPDAILEYSGVALFKRDKLVDWLNEEESKGYNYIMGKVKSTAGHVACPQGGSVAVNVIRTETKVIGKVVKDKPKIFVNLYVEQDVGEVQCNIELTKAENLRKLEELGEKKLTEIMESAIKKAKKNKADIFGFGDAIEDTDPKSWLKLKQDWDTHFSNLDVTVKVDVQNRRLGTTNNSKLER